MNKLLKICCALLFVIGTAHSYYPIRAAKKLSCQFFKNGYIYRGPCQSKKAQIVFDDGGRQKQSYTRPKLKSPGAYAACATVEGIDGFCRSPAYCFSQYDDIQQYLQNRCKQSNGLIGICCPTDIIREPAVEYLPIKIPIPYEPKVDLDIDKQDIIQSAEESKEIIKRQLEIERELIRLGLFQSRNSMESYHQAFFGPDDPDIQKISLDGLVALETTLQIAKKYKLSPEQARDGLKEFNLLDTSVTNHCPKTPICDRQSKYRTIDGSCNNLEFPLWGKSLTQFQRLLPPSYADGLNEFRMSIDGGALPNARKVSCDLAIDVDLPDKKFSLLVMQWGQIIDHDLTLTASTRAASGEGLECCNQTALRRTRIRHPACRPIMIPRDDPFYAPHNHFCNNFIRNAAGPRYDCNLGYREQVNTLTHIVDASMVYGSTDKIATFLRSLKNGLLRTSKVNNLEFLPFDLTNRSEECAISSRLQQEQHYHCFVGGDVRVNEQTGLTMLHNVLLREHNRVARILQNLNPNWNDEIVYQETRRIVAAVIQSITYNEWMPLIIGRKVMKEFNILVQPKGYTYDYDPAINPGILNSFATAVYRFHSLIQGLLKLLNNQGQVTQSFRLRTHFNNPTIMYRKGAYDEFLNGYSANPTQTFDQFFTEDITNHLFQEERETFGMDLIALNIQRGRDHGLPGYNAYREVCGLLPIKSFRGLEKVMRPGSARLMSKVYRYVDDIDLFIGGNHERALPYAVVGPTFACILGEQARRNKVGDRFWFENGGMKHSFNEAQLNEIRKASFASLICDNSYEIKKMQTLAFLQPLDWNPRVDCSKITRMDLSFWKNERV